MQYAKLKHTDANLQKIVSWDFKAGAKWKKEQMMKDAVECYIRRNRYTKQNVLNGFDVTCDVIQKFNNADKVKVIVIKENNYDTTQMDIETAQYAGIAGDGVRQCSGHRGRKAKPCGT